MKEYTNTIRKEMPPRKKKTQFSQQVWNPDPVIEEENDEEEDKRNQVVSAKFLYKPFVPLPRYRKVYS